MKPLPSCVSNGRTAMNVLVCHQAALTHFTLKPGVLSNLQAYGVNGVAPAQTVELT